jgi:two-component system, OmpR family, sensor histidine kinase QseC
MSVTASRARPSLVRTLTSRLVLITMLAMALQVAFVAMRDYFSETDFLTSYVRREATAIAREMGELQATPNGAASSVRLAHYFGVHALAYAFRVTDADGERLAAHNDSLLDRHTARTRQSPDIPDFWLRKLDPQARMHVAGGLKVRRDGRDIWVELMTLGDPDGSYLRVIALEILDDVWLPMVPLVLMTLGVTVLSVRSSLKPLSVAAQRADTISMIERGDQLDVGDLPEEVSQFATATNRLLGRVAELVAAQRQFIARAAHELRTPLSIMLLELGHVVDPRAKRLEDDVRSMSESVDRLLTLARLESMPRLELRPLDLTAISRSMVERMQDWAQKDGHHLSFVAAGPVMVSGDEAALREALRNLIENAVRHTPPGTKITVAPGREGAVAIEDSGPGLGMQNVDDLQLPFHKGNSASDGAGLGLAIVKQAMDLQNGQMLIGRSKLGGARFVLVFPRASAGPAGQY